MSVSINKLNNSAYWIQNTPKPLAVTNVSQQQQNDSFDKNNQKITSKQKAVIGTGIAVILLGTGLLIRNKIQAKNLLKKTKQTSEPVKTPKAEQPAPIKAPKEPVNAPVINYEKNGNPKALLGIDETEGRRLFDEYKKCQKMISEFKPWEELTQEESLARSKWYREVETPLRKKIEKHNVSIIETKEFSTNPLEQVKEKREYLEDIIYKMRTNEASYYDGLLEFEKYGKRERCAHSGVTTLRVLSLNFPQENVTEKTVNKFMDIYDRMAIFARGKDAQGLTQDIDWQGFINVIEQPGVLKTEEQAERAIKICKKLIYMDETVEDLYYSLIKKEGAVFKGNKKIEQQIRSIQETAKELRSRYKDDFGINLLEESYKENPIVF